MKKLLFGLLFLAISSFAFAESSFWGIPFGKTEKEVKTIERELESKLQEELQAFGGSDLTIGYGTKDGKISVIKFNFASTKGDTPYKLKSVFDFYFAEKLGCKYANGSYYNNDIIAVIDVSQENCRLYISDRKSFESIISKF